MEDRGDGRLVAPAKIARLLMIDDAQVNKIVGKFKKEFQNILEPSLTSDDLADEPNDT